MTSAIVDPSQSNKIVFVLYKSLGIHYIQIEYHHLVPVLDVQS